MQTKGYSTSITHHRTICQPILPRACLLHKAISLLLLPSSSSSNYLILKPNWITIAIRNNHLTMMSISSSFSIMGNSRWVISESFMKLRWIRIRVSFLRACLSRKTRKSSTPTSPQTQACFSIAHQHPLSIVTWPLSIRARQLHFSTTKSSNSITVLPL